MKKYFWLILTLTFALSSLQAQKVEALHGRARDGSTHRMLKDVPVQINPEVSGNGKPTFMYVIQLARFEDMPYIPEEFPAGTFLWQNPDHLNEKILVAGFYVSVEDAEKAVKRWKQNPMFENAFVRPNPFMIRYD